MTHEAAALQAVPHRALAREGCRKFDGVLRKISNQWCEEQNRCQREIDRLPTANQSYVDEGMQILELASNAQKLFESQEPRQKRRLLNFLLSNCSWEGGEVVATFRQPFDLLAENHHHRSRPEGCHDGVFGKN